MASFLAEPVSDQYLSGMLQSCCKNPKLTDNNFHSNKNHILHWACCIIQEVSSFLEKCPVTVHQRHQEESEAVSDYDSVKLICLAIAWRFRLQLIAINQV